MNKTVTINISGIIFHIEEDAYEKLSKYLSTIKGYFSKNESGNEIISDIEARVAELLQTKISQFKQVILMADVDFVINALGKPEEFGIEEEKETVNETETNKQQHEPIKKRMFRDPEEKSIGGVCSGIAHYFDVDVVWVRLATFLLVFFGGVSLWVYIILWIVIPEAKTTADRLAMKGERVNIDNISKSFKDELDGVKNRMKSSYGSGADVTRTIADKLLNILLLVFKFIGRVIGAFLIFIAVVIMFGLMSTIFGFSIAGDTGEVKDWINLIFIDRSHYVMGLIGLIFVVGIPAFMLLYGGIKLLFKIKFSNRWLNLTAGILWFIGFMLATYAGVKTASDFNEGSKFKATENIAALNQTFTISAASYDKLYDKYKIEGLDYSHESEKKYHRNEYSIGSLKENKTIVGSPVVKILPSSSQNIEIQVNKKARGIEKRIAYLRAKEINYSYVADSSGITLDEIFYVPSEQKFRVQEVEVLIKIPVGQMIYLDKSISGIIYDIDNVTNTYDEEMLQRRWKMTEKGLVCVDCDGIDTKEENDNETKNITINSEGIKVSNDETKITINEKGININNDNTDINLKKKSKKEK